jgi:hypothetical protein
MFFKDKEATREGEYIFFDWIKRYFGKLSDHVLSEKPMGEDEYVEKICNIVWPLLEEIMYSDSETKDVDVLTFVDERSLSLWEMWYIFDWIQDRNRKELDDFIKESKELQIIQKKKTQSKDISDMVLSSIDHATRWAVVRALWYWEEKTIWIAKMNLRTWDIKKLYAI